MIANLFAEFELDRKIVEVSQEKVLENKYYGTPKGFREKIREFSRTSKMTKQS